MDIDIYRNFLVVVANGTISEAARQLSMTQPALSMQMKALQASIGQELLVKGQGSHSLELTPAGHMVYNKALKICQLEDKLEQELEEKNEGLRGTISIPVFHWEDEFVLTKLIPAFHAKYPLVKFSLNWVNPLTMSISIHHVDSRMLLKRELPEYQEKYEVLMKGSVSLFAALRKDSPWLPQDLQKVDLRMLNGIPLAMSQNPNGKHIVNQMYHYGINPEVLIWTNFRKGALKSAESGMSLAIVFQDADKENYPELRYLPIEDEELAYCYVVGKPKGMKLSPLTQKYVDFAREFRAKYETTKNN